MDGVSSDWTDNPVPLDSSGAALGAGTYLVKDYNMQVGFQNDSNYFYIVMSTSDRGAKMQILLRGLTLWIDKDGGDSKVFGIKFPIGLQDAGLLNFQKGSNSDKGNDTKSEDRFSDMFDKMNSVQEIEIMGVNENDAQRVQLKDATGIDAMIDRINDTFIYRFKIAIKSASGIQYSLGMKNPVGNIGIGFETPEITHENSSAENQNGQWNGNKGNGNQHGEHQHRGNRGNGNSSDSSEPLKYWVSVQLSSGKSSQAK